MLTGSFLHNPTNSAVGAAVAPARALRAVTTKSYIDGLPMN
jgi:hypothetical protein